MARLGIFASQASIFRGRFRFISAISNYRPALRQQSQSLSSKRALAEVFYQHDVRIFQVNLSIEDGFAVG